ncbi:MAG: sugar ABC transporter substrate-binding protein [Clostridiales Family XIII bacterium]|jgi:ABC-type sugar transport system substrate-binding protein|nr:sugar ABC transporter substrate-binding protein [Clostridiales Family XIII bacterium]
MKKVLVALLVLAMLTTIALSGCSGKADGSSGGDDKLQVGILIRDLANPYYVQIQEGAELFLNKVVGDGKYSLTVYESGGSDEKQINDAKAFIASVKNGNGLLYVDPNNAPNAAVIADLAEDAGIYWNTTWSYADGVYPFDYEYYVLHETADNEVGAYETAKVMFDSFETPGKGKIVAVQGMLSNDASIDREKGWRKALEEYPDVELLDIQPSDWDAKEGLKLIQTWLSKYGEDIDGVLVCNDGVAVAVAEGLRAEGLNGKIKVTGFDGTDDILPLIESGDVLATFGSNAYIQAGYGLAYDYAALNGEIDLDKMPPEERMINTKGVIISTDTLAEYRKEFVENKPDYDYDDLEFPVSSYIDIDNLH